MRRGLWVLLICLVITAGSRGFDLNELHTAVAQETGSLGGSNVEGNARAVGGFVVLILQLARVIAGAHIVLITIVISFVMHRIAAPNNAVVERRYRSAISAYFAVGTAIGVLVALIPFGVFIVPAMLWSFSLGWWGGSTLIFGVLIPAVVTWRLRLRSTPQPALIATAANASAGPTRRR